MKYGLAGRVLVRKARRVAFPVLMVYLMVLLAMSFIETWLVYRVPPRQRGDWNPTYLEHENVWFQSDDGTRLFGWLVPHPQPRFAVVYCHGNAEHVADNADLMAILRSELQASVFIFDYRGYGRSEGRPYETGLVADTKAAQRWLARRMKIEPHQVVVMGRSLGGAVAVASAADLGARALVIESTFSRMTDTAQHLYPWLPVHLLMRNRYDSVARIARYTGPLFQSHGTNDTFIPIVLARELFDSTPSNSKEFEELRGYGHNNLPPRDYYAKIVDFLARHADE